MPLLLQACFCVCVRGQTDQPSQWSPTIARHYAVGETVGYKMTASNASPARTIRYEARVQGPVVKAEAGGFVEDFGWRELNLNGQPFALSPASLQFREPLSFAPDFRLTVPDLSKVQPILIGPITDLLTFYADVQLAMRQKGLVAAGDHVYVKHGVPSSWADGTRVILGQDAIDFDITLDSVDKANGLARLVVRHVPPPQSQVKLPVAWMVNPVAGTANNWVQVEKQDSGKFIAGAGAETFEARISISLSTGRIVSATMDNPVDVLERTCDDAELTTCADPVRYRILRQVRVEPDLP